MLPAVSGSGRVQTTLDPARPSLQRHPSPKAQDPMSRTLLIVEDDSALAQMLALHFEDEGYRCHRAARCGEAAALVRDLRPDLVLLDQQLPDGSGIDQIAPLLAIDPELPVLMMTGQHDLELAIEAISRGAADFVHKPVKLAELTATVARLVRHRDLARAAEAGAPPAPPPQRDLIGRSEAMLAVSKEIALCARSSATVLVTGESGTGKEVVARLIHQYSGRTGAFVAVNCAAIVDTLLESELFGHEKGAFTGASARKAGKFELANEGTLFLDEIGELAVPLQAKLLRALQERVVERVGGSEPVPVSARVVAATNRDLFAEAAEGRFREDLVYRLNVIRIPMPPLRERREDIPLLVGGLLARIAERAAIPLPQLTEGALARLSAHDWPGNVRELENLLTQAAVRARNGLVTPDLLGLDPAPASGDGGATGAPMLGSPQPDLRTLDELEAEHVQRILDHTGGHKGRACDILGISRPALDRKIARYGLRVPGR
jgi:DNA-binding NtrC family response regulator